MVRRKTLYSKRPYTQTTTPRPRSDTPNLDKSGDLYRNKTPVRQNLTLTHSEVSFGVSSVLSYNFFSRNIHHTKPKKEGRHFKPAYSFFVSLSNIRLHVFVAYVVVVALVVVVGPLRLGDCGWML